MRKIIYTVFSLIVLNYMQAESFGNPLVDKLYDKILQASFYNDKRDLGKQLGQLKSSEAKNALIKLINDSSYWNATAAVDGMMLFEDASMDTILVNCYFTNHMIDDVISEGINKNILRFYKPLEEKYYSLTKDDDRAKVIRLIAKTQSSSGELFLKKIISDDKAYSRYADRSLAFKYLVENYKDNNYDYVKQYINNTAFKEYVYIYIAENGNSEDLNFFIDVLNNKEAHYIQYLLPAYKAINKWGSMDLKKNTFLNALKEQMDGLIQGSILIFGNIQSPEIMNQLCFLVKRSQNQDTRLLAAENLVYYKSNEIIPYIILIFKEEFIQSDNTSFGDYFATIITFGLSSIAEKMSKKSNQNSFNERLNNISKSLISLTGVDNGRYYKKWFDWAIYNGYTIDGINIIQYLFSGYPDKRKSAVNAAIKLLGYRSDKDFFKDNQALLNTSEIELSIELTKLLIAKGYFKDEKF